MEITHMFPCSARQLEINESARVSLSVDDLLDAGQELASSQAEIRQLEDDFKSVRDDWKSRISAIEARITTLSGRISRGYDIKPVACKVYFDEPEAGLKTCHRLDTGERLWVKEMSDSDKQLTLDLEAEERAAADTAAVLVEVEAAPETEPAKGLLGKLAEDIQTLADENGLKPEMLLSAMTAIANGADTVTKLQGALKIGHTAAKKLFTVAEKAGAPAPEVEQQTEKGGESDEY